MVVHRGQVMHRILKINCSVQERVGHFGAVLDRSLFLFRSSILNRSASLWFKHA